MELDPICLDAHLAEIDWTVLPSEARADRFAAPSGALARIAVGPADGPRVLLVPGATGSKEDFLLLMPLLAAAGYRVESFDMAGQAESEAAGPEALDPPAVRYSPQLFVNDLLSVIAASPGPVHLLGYSFAGTVAAAAALQRPDLVSSLTLLCAPPTPGRALRTMKFVGRLAGLAGPRLSAAVMVQGIRWNLTRVPRSRQSFVRARLGRTRLSSVADIMRMMAQTPDLGPRLRESGIPCLVAVGTGDLWPVRRHREFARIAGADFVLYHAGHAPCETTPHQLATDLLRLFDRAERCRRP